MDTHHIPQRPAYSKSSIRRDNALFHKRKKGIPQSKSFKIKLIVAFIVALVALVLVLVLAPGSGGSIAMFVCVTTMTWVVLKWYRVLQPNQLRHDRWEATRDRRLMHTVQGKGPLDQQSQIPPSYIQEYPPMPPQQMQYPPMQRRQMQYLPMQQTVLTLKKRKSASRQQFAISAAVGALSSFIYSMATTGGHTTESADINVSASGDMYN